MGATHVLDPAERPRLWRRKLTLSVVKGPARGTHLTLARDSITVGSAPQNDLALPDRSVSRHHLRVEATPRGFLVTDLDSTNGTYLHGVELRQALIHRRVDLRLGQTVLRLTPLADEEEVPIGAGDRFGQALGRSAAIRHLFDQLAEAAPSEATVLLEGETGTGKELLAEGIHQHSARAGGPFVVVDCGAIPAGLAESELFGHRGGSFTGAVADRAGAFEQADRGTLFLDEIAELDLTLQPLLLRALERREVKRVGETQYRKVDVRVLAATNRDLHRAMNQRLFRSDLYYRLAVVHLRVPPLRDRPDDVLLLVEHMLPELAARHGLAEPPVLSAETLQQLCCHAWPGNARELRNFLERLLALSAGGEHVVAPSLSVEDTLPPSVELDDLARLPFREAKSRWTAAFDVAYLRKLLERNRGNVASAARDSRLDRVHLFRLIKKYKLRS